MQNRDSFAQQHASADHIVFPKTKARLAAASLSAATCSLCLCVCERVRHHRLASSSRAREPEPLCLSVTGTHGVSSVLAPLGRTSSPQNTSSAMLLASSAVMQHSLPPAPEHCHSESIREFSGPECSQRLFRSQRLARSWFFSTLVIRQPGQRR